MMLDGIISLLNADPTVTSFVSGRIYKSVLVRGFSLPAVAVHRYGGSQEYDFNGPVGVREDQVQLDAYASDAETTQQVTEAIRAVLVGFKGALPDGTIVQACFLERDMDMPFMPHADSKGIANRSLLGFRFVTKV